VCFTLLFIGVWQYLPFHVVFIYERARYYLLGQEASGVREAGRVIGMAG
jgi:hypothetical protein